MPDYHSDLRLVCRLNMYYDVFVFPWLKYRVDAPSRGRDLSDSVNLSA